MTDLEKLKQSFKSHLFNRETHNCLAHGRTHTFITPRKQDFLPVSLLLQVISEIEEGTWSEDAYEIIEGQ